MSITYNITTNFGAKDELPANDPDKIVFGSEFTQEFTAIKSAFTLAAPTASPTFTGTATFANATVNGTLTADLTGDVTGTVLTAAQPNITSVGSLLNLDVTGTTTTDALTVATAQGNVSVPALSSTIDFARAGTSYLRATDASGNFRFVTGANDFAVSRLAIADNGDISFYEDTGTTAKFFWDASAERLGIGTTTPSSTLDVTGTVTADALSVLNGVTTTGIIGTGDNQSDSVLSLQFRDRYGTPGFPDGQIGAYIQSERAGALAQYDLVLGTISSSSADAVQRLRITDDGDISFYEDTGTTPKFFWDASAESLGIGTSSPSEALEINGNLKFSDGAARTIEGALNQNLIINSLGNLTGEGVDLRVNGTSVLLADFTGNVGIGTSSPQNLLHVAGASAGALEMARFRLEGATNNPMLKIEANEANQTAGIDVSGSTTTELTFSQGGAERMRIDSSGNVGIGTTSPASALEVADDSVSTVKIRANALRVGSVNVGNGYMSFGFDNAGGATERLRINDSGNVGIGTSSPSYTLVVNGGGDNYVSSFESTDTGAYSRWADNATTENTGLGASGNALILVTSGVEQARIASSGNVGIGDTSPSRKLSVRDVSATPFISIVGSTSSIPGLLFGDADSDAVGQIRYDNTNNSMTFTTANTVKMLIQSDGNMLIGKTAKQTQTQGLDVQQLNSSDTDAALGLKSGTNATTGNAFINCFLQNGVGSGRIESNGAQALAFAAFSDRNLKENIEDLPSQLANVMQLRPVEFDYKDGSGHQIGFIAQEVEEVWPDLVSGEEGSKSLVGLGKTESRLIKALQEAVGRIEALEAEVAALKAGV